MSSNVSVGEGVKIDATDQRFDERPSLAEEWKCPHCDYTDSTEQAVRRHITQEDDSQHKGHSGSDFSCYVVALDENGEEINEFKPREEESEIDLPLEVPESSLSQKQKTILKQYQKDLTQTSEEVAEIVQEQHNLSFNPIYPNTVWNEKVQTEIFGVEFTRVQMAVLKKMEDMGIDPTEHGSKSKIFEEVDVSEPTVYTTLNKYLDAKEEYEQEQEEQEQKEQEEKRQQVQDALENLQDEQDDEDTEESEETDTTMSTESIPVEEVEEIQERIELIEDVVNDEKAEVASRINSMLDDLSGGDNARDGQ
ncbi:C2H2-type zinc finger protein [Halogeometricum borinquense]|uniref:C2H2-type zinc finger protein n=1 Tax=Halogeometricum borinquense TaxID=60847 RepID=A0A6C0UIG2_9EURY|nr:C2H2-type zinc finger protein [Halogeometricum borinquense]QIB75215.1 C2H2-type zinc finger protein [Halogeometricum borinquense]